MSRQKAYIDTDVVTEAKKRIRHAMRVFDTCVVMFSGGKDSLSVLELMHQVYVEDGIQEPVNVVFRDEELIPMDVIDFVDEYRRKSWIKMLWFAVPLKSTKYVLGQTFDYIQWDPARAVYCREKPEWSITLPPGDNTVLSQFTADTYIANYYPKGKVAFFTGIRADESIMRYRSVVNKLNENYINAPVNYDGSSPLNVRVVKPIYDWTVNDIFKFLGENNIKYCPLYNAELWSGSSLRVATPLIAESSKHFDDLKQYAPDLYQQVITIFPEMLAHERYYHEVDQKAVMARYGLSIAGIRAWIYDVIEEEHQQALAVRRLDSVASRMRSMPEAYPVEYVFNAFMSGGYKREILPQMGAKKK